MSGDNRSKLIKGVAWIGAARVMVNSLGVISTVALARLLMPGDFGLIAIATAVIGIIGVISEFSLYKALVQRDNPEPEHFHTVWTMNVIRGAIVGAIIALLAVPLSRFYGDERLSDILMLMAVTTLVGSFVNPMLAVFERELQFHQSFILSLTGKVVGFLATVGIAYFYRSYWALVIGPLITECVLVAMSYLLFPFMPRPSLSRYRELLSYSIWLTFGKWVQAINWRADPLLLGYFLSPQLLGQYSMGHRVTSKSIGEAIEPLRQVLFPAFSRIKNEPDRLRHGYLRAQGVLCLICFPIAAGLASVAPEFVVVALGPKWDLAIPIVQLTAMLRLLQITVNLNALAMATGHTKEMFGRDIRALIVRWPMILTGVYLGWGDAYHILLGAICGMLASAVLNNFLNMRLVQKITTITVTDHLIALWRPAVAAAMMALAVLAVRPWLLFGTDFQGLVLRLCVMVPLGAIVYLSALLSIWVLTGRRDGVETETARIVLSGIAKARSKFFRKRSAG
ncbi:lipopolysaccharide biosynthesis protein [Aurantiacibacter suaedae]|uniref:lipopolysaccharide biosynthesis protein n=1 Tax=Aurantiacibacter suaedae TaxID=2545755 RepID=UPI0010F4E451|nr:lipopolysaccharide biosynthesis protein [Aurantiacibacter suaedae]